MHIVMGSLCCKCSQEVDLQAKIFKDGFNLHNFVKMAILTRKTKAACGPCSSHHHKRDGTCIENEVNYMNGANHNEIEAEEENIDYENLSNMNTYIYVEEHTSSPYDRTCMLGRITKEESIWRMPSGTYTKYTMLSLVLRKRDQLRRR